MDEFKKQRGRPRKVVFTPHELRAQAQARFREKQQQEGKKQLNLWISAEAAAYLTAIKTIHHQKNQAEALALILEAAMKGIILQQQF